MELYVANGTHQKIDFTYRVPEFPSARVQPIAVGGQIRISGGLNVKQIESIIKQYEHYGMVPVDEILDSKRPAPLAFQVDKPIASELIEMLIQRNQGQLVDIGRETRKNAAIVATSQLGTQMRENNIPGELGQVEIEITEEKNKDNPKTPDDLVSETVVANREGQKPRPTLKGRRN